MDCHGEIKPSNELLAVLATQAIANVIKSSFGPSGLDKMMVDDIGVWNTAVPTELCSSF